MLHPQACAMFHGCFPFVNMEGERFMNEGTWVQGKSMNIMNQTGASMTSAGFKDAVAAALDLAK